MNKEPNRIGITPLVDTNKLIGQINRLLKQPLFTNNIVIKFDRLSKQLAFAVNILSEAVQNMPTLSKPIIKDLASIGWYVSLELPLNVIWQFDDDFKQNQIRKIDEYMISFFEQQSKLIENDLLTIFPQRSSIIQKAFVAHHNEDYELSVPVFLAQADGICLEILGVKLYSTKRGILLTQKIINNIIDCSFTDACLEPLRNVTLVNASEDNRPKFTDSFNRHEILHGISTGYGTKTNSLKSISLLHYLSTIVLYAITKNKKTEKVATKQ